MLADYAQGLHVPGQAEKPLQHARCCVVGLVAVSSLRGCAVNVYNAPAGLHWTAHMLSVAADVIAIVGAAPVFTRVTLGACVEHRCLGSLMTLLLTAALCDLGAAIIFFSTAGGSLWALMGAVATDEGAPSSVAFIGVWECILLSSNLLETALCVSAWRFYCAFREAGIYPPDASNVRVHKEVSPLELVCEAEDVALLSDHCSGGCGAQTQHEEQHSLPYRTVGHSPFGDSTAGFGPAYGLHGHPLYQDSEIIEDELSSRECWAL